MIRRCARLPPLCGLLAMLVGCRTQADDTVLETVHRLVDELASTRSSDTPRACAAGDEIRPALGCLENLLLVQRKVRADSAGTANLEVELPDSLRARGFLAEPLVRSAWAGMWLRHPATLVPPGGGDTLSLRLTSLLPGKSSVVELRAHPLPPPERRFETRDLPIGHGAQLTVALAVEGPASAPTEFRILARTMEAERQLAHLSLGGASGWREHRVDLAALAGESVRFVFLTEANPSSGGVPLWGSPLVLEPKPRGERRNILLMSLDTLRADHVGAERAGLPLTAGLDELSSQGAVFEQAIAPYPSTTASHMSLFTGLYPATHRVSFPSDTLEDGISTLPEILARHGYVTAAFTENAMLAPKSGFARGFDAYWELKEGRWATGDVERTVAAAADWLEAHQGERFFVFLHTYQVHAPYDPPAEFDLAQPAASEAATPGTNASPDPARDRDRYAGEVRFTDSVLSAFLRELERRNELASSIVVVTSDHGEEFGEHGDSEHSRTVYDEVLRVPLILWAPGIVPAAARIDAQTSLIDLVPTLLELVGIAPEPSLDGRGLRALLAREDTFEDRVVFAEKRSGSRGPSHLVAARTTSHKWIARLDQETPLEIYDLRSDPEERATLDDPELRQEGEKILAPYIARARRSESAREVEGRPRRGVGPRSAKKLRALGYLE